MFLARILFFRLHESPRYLVHAGRPQEALVSLQMISRFNGSDLTIELDDVDDHHPQAPSLFNDDQDARTPFLANGRDGTPFIDQSSTKAVSRERLPETTQCPPSVTPPTANIIGGHADVKDYRSTHESPAQLDSQDTGLDGDPELTVRTTHVNPTPVFSVMPIPDPIRDSPSSPSIRRPRTGVRQRSLSESRYSHLVDLMSERAGGKLPRWIRKPLRGWLDRVALVLSPAWLRTTVLVWLAWCSMALGELPSTPILSMDLMVSSLHHVQRIPSKAAGNRHRCRQFKCENIRRYSMGCCNLYNWRLSRCYCKS